MTQRDIHIDEAVRMAADKVAGEIQSSTPVRSDLAPPTVSVARPDRLSRTRQHDN